MSENVRKLVGVAIMAVLVVVGVVVSSGDDTDFTRNRSFSAAPSTSEGADRVREADCCDQTLALLKTMQDQHAEISSQLADNSSKLQTLLNTESGASTSAVSSDLQQIADQMGEACPDADPANWNSLYTPGHGANCMQDYLAGFPLELARQVVLTHGKYGFFHRFNIDLASLLPIHHVQSNSIAKAAVTEEACQQIFYGYNPPPRFAVFVDTKDGLVLPNANEFLLYDGRNGMIQYVKDAVLINNATPLDNIWFWNHHWPTQVATHGLCE